MGIGAEGADRSVSFANTGYVAILPATPTLGEFVAGVGKLHSPGLRVEPDGGTELLDIIGGDRDDNGGGGEPLCWVRLEVASSEDRDLDGILDRFRKCLAELAMVVEEVGCGELLDGKLHVIGSWTEGPEGVIPDREGQVKLEGHSLVVRSVGSSGSVDIVGREGEGATNIDRRGEGNWVGPCRFSE